MKDHFKNLFEYNDWANIRVIESIKETDNVDEKAIKLISHIIAAQRLWLMRIVKDQKKQQIDPWAFYSIDECINQSNKSTKDWLRFINETTEDEFESLITYKNTKGNIYENKIKEILTHVVNHSSYHRGQIASIVKSNGGKSAVTDFIAYVR